MLAGAIALGEATDGERREYRQHLAGCSTCLQALGGEHELERTAAIVGAARECEVWQPDLSDAVASKMQARKRVWRFGLSVLGICLAVSFVLHVAIASGLAHLTPTLADPLVLNYGGMRIALERRGPVPKSPPPVAQRRMVVVHNVVQLSRAPVANVAPATDRGSKAEPTSAPRQIAAAIVHPDPQTADPTGAQSNVPIWRRGAGADTWHTIAKTTTTAFTESAPQVMNGRLESIQIAATYTTRDAAPIGGDTAINPQPPMIATDEGAQGTAVFAVSIDERGVPTKCTITKSSNYPVLDTTVCSAAMKAHYTPKTVNGKAVPGVYTDAFTFRNDNGTEGLSN
jgi:TonB family protein